MPEPFDSKPAHSLKEDEQEMIRHRFGKATLPEDSLVTFDGNVLTIEHFSLDRYLELNPELNMEVIADGKLSFPK